MTTNPNNSNDYAVAKVLSMELIPFIALVRVADKMELPEDYEINQLNRAYVFLVHELENLYNKHPKLAEINPEPFWKQFDVLITQTLKINEYLDNPEHDMGQAHIARLEKLCIVTGIESAELSSEQKKLIEQAADATQKYVQILDEARLDKNRKIEESWYIPEYRLSYQPDGTILVNDVLKLKKTHIASTLDHLLEQAFKNQNKLFTPTLPQTARNLSTLLSSAGFTLTLRQLFFPVVSTRKGVFFRPVVTLQQARHEKIDTTKLDLILKALDADHTFSA